MLPPLGLFDHYKSQIINHKFFFFSLSQYFFFPYIQGVAPYLEQPMAPSSSIPGRPVPTFYGEGGQVLAPPPIDQQYGIDGGQVGFDHPGYEQVMPQGPAVVGTQYGFPCDGGTF